MPSSSSMTAIQNLYVAYYGRPADYNGQVYWAGQLEAEAPGATSIPDSILAAFANSAESQALYGTDNASQLITAAYQTMFNRAPDAAGLAYWTNAINTGAYSFVTAVNAIANAASGNDAGVLANKQFGAMMFTQNTLNYGNDNGAWFTGATALADARNFLAQIDLSWNSGTANVNGTVGAIYQAVA